MKPSVDRHDIDVWQGRIQQAKDQKWVKQGILKRRNYTDWFHSEFWGQHAALDSEQGELNVHRDVNWIQAWIRMLHATLYAADPILTCVSPWHHPMFRQVLSEVATNTPRATGFKDVAKMCYQDAGLGGWGASRVGYEPVLGWSATAEAEQRQRAQQSLQRLAEGVVPPVDDTQDHEIWAEMYEQYFANLAQSGLDPSLPVMRELRVLIAKHQKALESEPTSPVWHLQERKCWVSRIEPVIDGEPQILWEVETDFADASWVAVKWCKTLDEVKQSGEKGYFDNTENLEASELSRRGSKEWIEQNAQKYGAGFGRDVRVVKGWDVYDREHSEKLVVVPGYDKYLKKTKWGHADILKAAGIHILTLMRHESYEPGCTPLDAAASDIELINKVEGVLAVILQKTVSALVYNKNALDPADAENIFSMNVGESLGIDIPLDRSIRDYIYETPVPKLYEQTLAVLYRAEARMSMNLGMGDAKIKGQEGSRTATQASVIAGADEANTSEWNRQGEDWTRDNVADLLQLQKRYYGPDEVRELVGMPMADAWPDPWPDELLGKLEELEVVSGSSLPGFGARQAEMRMAAYDRLSADPLADQVELRRWMWTKEPFNVPSKVFQSPAAQQEVAGRTPGSEDEVQGSEETAAEGPIPGGGNGSEKPDAMRAMYSNANRMGADQR